MRIAFSIEGGVAFFPGLARPTHIDTAQLPGGEGEKLEQLVVASGFFERAETQPHAAARDARTYVVEVQEAERQRVLRVQEPVPPDLQPLIEALRARKRAR